MKTKEFIKIMEDAGLHVDVADNNIRIKKEYECSYYTLAIVSETESFSLDTRYHTFYSQSAEVKAFILDNLYKYASTPVSERKSITLLPAERVILESLSQEYKGIRLDGNEVLTLEGFIVEYDFSMFGGLFDWVEKDKIYKIYDLLNDCEVAE